MGRTIEPREFLMNQQNLLDLLPGFHIPLHLLLHSTGAECHLLIEQMNNKDKVKKDYVSSLTS